MIATINAWIHVLYTDLSICVKSSYIKTIFHAVRSNTHTDGVMHGYGFWDDL